MISILLVLYLFQHMARLTMCKFIILDISLTTKHHVVNMGMDGRHIAFEVAPVDLIVITQLQ